MTADAILLPVFVAVFAMAGIWHVLIWIRNTVAREHFWFGVTSLLAASAAAVEWVPGTGAWMDFAARGLPVVLAASWLIAATWFVVEHAGGSARQRRAALLATLLFAAIGVAVLARGRGFSQGFLGLLGVVPVAVLVWLIVDGVLRLWSSARRVRAVSLVALGIVVCLLAVQGLQSQEGSLQVSEPAVYSFVLVTLAMAYELAGVMADGAAVSERQRQELAHASRLSIVGELTASIAHEINQPLGAILANADAGEILLESPEPPLDEIRRILGDVRRDSLRARDVIRHVRTLVGKRNRELELERIDANFFVTDVIALLEPEASRRRIFFETDLSPQPLSVYADRGLLEQVHINLILNAMDSVEALSARAGGTAVLPPIVVGVSTTRHGEIEFRISDAGTGIPSEQLAHLFDSFYTSKPHGMGLGLSIARSVVEAHGGQIQAENNLNGGATFRVRLPPYSKQVS